MVLTPTQRSTKDHFVIYKFTYGDPVVPVRYTDSTQDETIQGELYESVTTLELKLPGNGIGLDDKAAKLKMPLDSFTDPLSNGEPHPEVRVTIKEVTESAGEQDINTLFLGRVIAPIRNFEGKPNIVLLQIKGLKSRLDFSVGLTANHHCEWPFGDSRTCRIDAPAFGDQGVTISAISGKQVTVENVLAFPALFFHRGYILRNTLTVSIRDALYVDGGGGAPPGFGQAVLELVREAPSEWLTNAVDLIPGCDKTIETCRGRWDNEINFMGIGFGIPAHHGVIEDTMTDLDSSKGAPWVAFKDGDPRVHIRPCT